MTPHYFRNSLISLELFAVLAQCANLNYSGEAITTRFWDCCKPSCAWTGKAEVNKPVLSCTADNKVTDVAAGTACGTGGTAYQCSNQQPWAINDTLSYGYAGVFITSDLTHGGIEGAWCCACYQLDFTSEPLKGKSLIIQASNTAYDVTSTNRFSLAVSFFFQIQAHRRNVNSSRYPVATPHHKMHAHSNLVWTRVSSDRTIWALAKRRIVINYQMR
jgi:hypothetical protein